MWEQVDIVLKDAKGILDELQAYKGAGQEIREVTSTYFLKESDWQHRALKCEKKKTPAGTVDHSVQLWVC